MARIDEVTITITMRRAGSDVITSEVTQTPKYAALSDEAREHLHWRLTREAGRFEAIPPATLSPPSLWQRVIVRVIGRGTNSVYTKD